MNTDCSVGTETHKMSQTSFSTFVNNEGKIQSPVNYTVYKNEKSIDDKTKYLIKRTR